MLRHTYQWRRESVVWRPDGAQKSLFPCKNQACLVPAFPFRPAQKRRKASGSNRPIAIPHRINCVLCLLPMADTSLVDEPDRSSDYLNEVCLLLRTACAKVRLQDLQ